MRSSFALIVYSAYLDSGVDTVQKMHYGAIVSALHIGYMLTDIIAIRRLPRSWRFWECLSSSEVEYGRDCSDQAGSPVGFAQERAQRNYAGN